jgi:hypothetical protein
MLRISIITALGRYGRGQACASSRELIPAPRSVKRAPCCIRTRLPAPRDWKIPLDSGTVEVDHQDAIRDEMQLLAMLSRLQDALR